jgi:N-hydroxyarylamine O-acetyltransferase
VLDLEAYLSRLGCSGHPSVVDLHRAHVSALPFENLDPYRGLPVSLAPEDLERKLVTERRGGYCFELNLLLKAGLEALGAEVQPMLARSRVGAAPGVTRPRTHLLLRVKAEGTIWCADAGFGLGGLFEPIPLAPELEHEQCGWRFRLHEQAGELVLQTVREDAWSDLYAFVPEPVPMIDVEVSNWFACTSPASPFVTGLVISAQALDGTHATLRNWNDGGLVLRELGPQSETITPVTLWEVPELLATRFGVPGYALGDDGRLVHTEIRTY